MDLSDAVTPALLLLAGGLAYVIKYVLPKISIRIDELEKHKANAVTVEQVKELLRDERGFMREVITNAILKAENERLKLKD